MIIDSHAYCFASANSRAGYDDTQMHNRWIQASYAIHHQPAVRLSDRKIVPEAARALDPGARHDLDNLPDRQLRFDSAEGRVLWEFEGDTYTKYFYPPNLRNGEYTPESLISEMDNAGVDSALLHTNPMLGRGAEYSAYLSTCIARYPDRLRSMAPVEEYRVAADPDAMIAEVDGAIRECRLHALKFNASLSYLGCPDPWDDGPYRPFWEAVTTLNIPVFFTLGSRPASLRAGDTVADEEKSYIDELQTLVRWMNRYPQAVCSVTHGFPYRMYLKGNRVALPESVWAPFENPNCHMEVCFPVRVGDLFDYPYAEVRSVLQEMADRIGPERLLWGTDMPFQNRFCTYRQSRAWIENYCEFLSEDDMDWIMGKTVSKILKFDN